MDSESDYGSQQNWEHSDQVPKLGFWYMSRMPERVEYGENIVFGPGYGQCVEHYYESELGSDIPNNRLLDLVAEKMFLPRDRIVPVIAGSMNVGEYLDKVVIPEKVIPLSTFLDVVICGSSGDALRLRGYSPILLPLSVTKKVITDLESGLELGDRGGDFIERVKESRNEMRASVADSLQVPRENLSLHLGADEIIKSVFRGIAMECGDQDKKPTVFIPLPNYFDALNFARRFGFGVIPDFGSNDLRDIDEVLQLWIEKIKQHKPDAIYLSNPNNPLGYKLGLTDLRVLLQALSPSIRVMIDEVNLDFGDNQNIFSSPWKELMSEFPEHHLIFIDSLSKSHDMASERLGFGLASQKDDVQMLRNFEPPFFPAHTFMRTFKAIHGEPIENQTRTKAGYFYRRLMRIQETSEKRITVSSTVSNFCIVEFSDTGIKDAFIKKIKDLNPAQIPAKRIVGLPIKGSGDLTPDDLNSVGVLKDEAFERGGIIGLSINAVRLSALSHPVILDALESALAH